MEIIPLHGRYVGEREIRDDGMHVYVCKHKLISVVRDQSGINVHNFFNHAYLDIRLRQHA